MTITRSVVYNDHDNIHRNDNNAEPVVMYAASEAAKSDIATVCSNSVVEDIDADVVSVGTIESEFIRKSGWSRWR